MKFRYLAAVAGFASLSFASPGAMAAPCAGFNDVDDSDQITGPFCTSVQWIRNRGVTVGCTPTLYCPNDPVTRLQMAAFMQRLGNVLTPVLLQVNQTKAVAGPPLYDLDIADLPSPPGSRAPAAVLCQSQPFTVTDYRRTAVLKADFSGGADGPVQVFGIPAISVDGGTTFQDAVTFGMRSSIGSIAGTGWVYAWQSMAQNVTVDLEVGSTYIFGYYVARAAEDLIAGGTRDLANWRCSLTVEIRSRTGATPPI
ncbi:MAG: hypothetical protein BroJett026_26200 [Betaproteobacteria bacterium]|nr:MAG: hypothetical protein BroJett026_26200 [Betaproteobacteria bacterium]